MYLQVEPKNRNAIYIKANLPALEKVIYDQEFSKYQIRNLPDFDRFVTQRARAKRNQRYWMKEIGYKRIRLILRQYIEKHQKLSTQSHIREEARKGSIDAEMAKRAIVGLYTYGYGSLPQLLEQLYDELVQQNAVSVDLRDEFEKYMKYYGGRKPLCD